MGFSLMDEWARGDILALIGLMVAVVSCLAALAAVPSLWRRYRPRDLVILEPRNKQELPVYAGEHKPIKRPIAGEVIGFSAKEIQRLGLFVEVSIKTDTWYQQGSAPVESNGKWLLREASFGGSNHIIRALLKDRHKQAHQSAEIEVLVA
jgi:hypothetical protein